MSDRQSKPIWGKDKEAGDGTILLWIFIPLAVLSAGALFAAMCGVFMLLWYIIAGRLMSEGIQNGSVQASMDWGTAALLSLVFSVILGLKRFIKDKFALTPADFDPEQD